GWRRLTEGSAPRIRGERDADLLASGGPGHLHRRGKRRDDPRGGFSRASPPPPPAPGRAGPDPAPSLARPPNGRDGRPDGGAPSGGLSLGAPRARSAPPDHEQPVALRKAPVPAGSREVQGEGRPGARRPADPAARREEGGPLSAHPVRARRP